MLEICSNYNYHNLYIFTIFIIITIWAFIILNLLMAFMVIITTWAQSPLVQSVRCKLQSLTPNLIKMESIQICFPSSISICLSNSIWFCKVKLFWSWFYILSKKIRFFVNYFWFYLILIYLFCHRQWCGHIWLDIMLVRILWNLLVCTVERGWLTYSLCYHPS